MLKTTSNSKLNTQDSQKSVSRSRRTLSGFISANERNSQTQATPQKSKLSQKAKPHPRIQTLKKRLGQRPPLKPSSSAPISPQQALSSKNLNEFERREILEFKEIFYVSPDPSKFHLGDDS